MEVTYKPKDLMVKFEVLPLQPQPGDLTITTESRLKPGLGYEDGRFFDTETGQYMSISEAIERGLIVIDWESGMVINKYTNEVNSQGVSPDFITLSTTFPYLVPGRIGPDVHCKASTLARINFAKN